VGHYIGSVGNAFHGGTPGIVRVVGPPALELEGMGQRLREITFHGAGRHSQLLGWQILINGKHVFHA
jgi:hypothetical protein